HTNNLGQLLLCWLLESGALAGHLKLVCEEYRKRRDALTKALRRRCGDDLSFETPQGGFYLWCRINARISAGRLLQEATGEGLSFVPGEAFYAHPSQGEREFRLCFATHSEDRLQEAAQRLTRALATVLKAGTAREAPGTHTIKPII
ncbi:MAG: aminotransferase class I/II-fold pyridoxal phosphate-dependent enzyme, partial [Bacillota bacterium]|nr:aminotransferase class I/II-fold pyridoxal phosphate-dependent enzyme [Bacillota bacterium]